MIADFDTIYDADGGSFMGFLLYPEKGGSIDPMEVDDFLNRDDAAEYLYDDAGGCFEAVETYVRKVPAADGWTRYVYSGPGRGARRCLCVELWSQWEHWCMNHIYEPAAAGIPVEQVANPIWPMVSVHITRPERRRPHARGPQDGTGYVYLCRDCHQRFEERRAAAAAERMAEWHASRPA